MVIRLSDIKMGRLPCRTEDERHQLETSLIFILDFLSEFLKREQAPLNQPVRRLLSRCGIQIKMEE